LTRQQITETSASATLGGRYPEAKRLKPSEEYEAIQISEYQGIVNAELAASWNKKKSKKGPIR